MQFSKAEKCLHETNNYNPPPGYYATNNQSSIAVKPGSIANTNFTKQQRFVHKQQKQAPGPGYYYNDKAQKVRKRIIEEAKRRQNLSKINNSNAESQIKISSIPSIPKKSTTRVYEQLAPGILILHQQQNQGVNIGPGSYNINYEGMHKKTVAHKINPQHKKRVQIQQPQIKIPTIAQQIRNQKRLLYKRNLIKSSAVNKSAVSPSDLCLQVIILRQKLLRSEQNPPPGLYYNEKYQSTFKQPDPDLLPQYQLMMGKQQRFKQQTETQDQVGPGAYQIQVENNRIGGFIPKGQRIINDSKKAAIVPGPGAYKVESVKSQITNPKGNYPPIFGSGSSRFMEINSSISQTPGPGSYKAQKSNNKKAKYIKIKRQFYQSQIVKPQNSQQKSNLFSLNGDKSRSVQTSFFKQRNKQKNNHYFTSKVQRFQSQDKNENSTGPGNYQISNGSFLKQGFNKNHEYIGSKQPRFDDVRIRPNLGPGAYNVSAGSKFGVYA